MRPVILMVGMMAAVGLRFCDLVTRLHPAESLEVLDDPLLVDRPLIGLRETR